MKKFAAIAASLLLLVAALGYTTFWFITAGQIETQIAALVDQAPQNGVTITGSFDKVHGFPGRHRISFSGTIQKDEITVTIPVLQLHGFPLPGRSLSADFPEGLTIRGDGFDETIWSLGALSVTGIIPKSLPDALTAKDLGAWRDDGGKIEFTDFTLQKESLQASGNGFLTLDRNLQPAGEVTAHITGHSAFLGWLQEHKLVEKKQALITGAILGGLSRQYPKTGERTIDAIVTLQRSTLLLGPLMLMPVPQIEWDDNIPLPYKPSQ